MKRKAVAWIIVCLAACFFAASPSLASTPSATGDPPDPSFIDPFVLPDSVVRISEVLARPPAGQHQWVELHRSGPAARLIYLPLVLKAAGQAAAVEAAAVPPDMNAMTEAAPAASPDPDISGWQVSNQSGGNYTIPAALPPVPPGAFILIRFDGQAADKNDYSFSDGLAVLHAPANIFVPAADQVALYSEATHNAQTIRDFVAYGGAPGDAASDAISAGLWKAHWWIDFSVGSGAQEAGAPPPANRSIGLLPGHANHSPDDWAVYGVEDQTPGHANPTPRAVWTTAATGATMASDGFALGWMFVPGATYQLQIDNNADFGTPLVDLILSQPYYQPASPMPGGIFWWRVRSSLGTQQSAWSTPLSVTVVPVAGASAASDTDAALGVAAEKVLAITWLRQKKDNPLLCLDGDDEGNPATSGQEVAWDAVHTDGIYTHGRNSCVRASIAMIVTRYGGSLSMDRIGYRLFENGGSPLADIGEIGNPLRDLGHDRTTLVCGGDGSHGGQLLSWALGGAAFDYGHENSTGKPTFAQIRGWIDANRPIMRFFNGHQTVIGGYRTLTDSTEQIRLFDPWSGTTWENYNTLSIRCYYVAPASAPDVRSDEPAIWSDSDGDGIMDWDEQVRFHTQAAYADSDDDWVPDKADLREYVFDSWGAYSLRTADLDADGQRKEKDANNDGDGAVDGCEDLDRDGKYEPASGETNNFDALSQRACLPIFEILQPTQTNPVNAGANDAPDKILIQVKTATPPSAPVTYTAASFKVQIGGQESPVLAAYRALDTHFLVVSAAAQAAPDYYDLTVTLDTQTDTETRAVFYLPKLRADQVLVIDRSGSMTEYEKIAAAKNAARAFIDHTNVDDMIGVVSFASDATVDYPLTTVAGDTQWNAAKAAVNGLAASGVTALGQGARLGYDSIVAAGRDDHDWSLALLSDGMENVSPYWSDATVSGVIVPSRVVVHTVALGRDADTSLLNHIAGVTDGRAFEAGVDVLPAAAATGIEAPAAPPGPNLPTTLPNRLADVYKAIGEVNGHQQRIWERTGNLCEMVTFEVPIEKGLPEAIFTVNWDTAEAWMEMTLSDPDGVTVKHNPPKVREIRDATHHQFRVQEPMGGAWVVRLLAKPCTNYLFILSARSQTSMHLGFGLPPAERTVGSAIPILVVLTDEKPIANAEVWALVQGPGPDVVELLQLYDDGRHADGRSGDGVYGGHFKATVLPGQYVVKATGWGKNSYGEPFERHRTGGFSVLPRVGYIWEGDLATAVAYRELLQGDGYTVDLIHIDEVPKTDWTRYSLVVIGPETGDGSRWGTTAAVDALLQYAVPVLGLGEGGHAFFGKVRGLIIGYPNGWHGDEARTVKVSATSDVWRSPYAILGPRDLTVTVYKKTAHVGVQIEKPPAGVTLIGREPADALHYNLVRQDIELRRFLLWGFQAGPPAMTAEGRHLFINVARFLAGM